MHPLLTPATPHHRKDAWYRLPADAQLFFSTLALQIIVKNNVNAYNYRQTVQSCSALVRAALLIIHSVSRDCYDQLACRNNVVINRHNKFDTPTRARVVTDQRSPHGKRQSNAVIVRDASNIEYATSSHAPSTVTKTRTTGVTYVIDWALFYCFILF